MQDLSVQLNDVITIKYWVRVRGGRTVYSSEKNGPLTFKVGSFLTVKGLNNIAIGMLINEKKKAFIGADEAFGERDENLISNILLSELPKFIRVGENYFDKVKRSFFNVISVDCDGGTATLDGNHLLAGEVLEFSIEIKDINRPPSENKFGESSDSLNENHINYGFSA